MSQYVWVEPERMPNAEVWEMYVHAVQIGVRPVLLEHGLGHGGADEVCLAVAEHMARAWKDIGGEVSETAREERQGDHAH